MDLSPVEFNALPKEFTSRLKVVDLHSPATEAEVSETATWLAHDIDAGYHLAKSEDTLKYAVHKKFIEGIEGRTKVDMSAYPVPDRS